ncbi:hypothetical protein [Lactococcus lactis]|uniref:hypothetical protein n=1 Tax=Lactococcus lactis TaxID=1358 RepID=UPI0022E76438|nr:hypothetical protein [Lactococcus lactis]
MEKSFILIKPDMRNNEHAKKKLKELISESNLIIYRSTQVRFDEQMIESMWPQFKDDVISNRILNNYLDQKFLEMWYVEGEEAILNCLKIKKKIRLEFSNSPFQSCIHTPSNFEECIYDKNILRGSDGGTYKLSKTAPSFIPINDMGYTKERLKNEADELWSVLCKDRDFLFNTHERLFNKELYALVLHNTTHPNFNISLEYVVASILTIIPSYKISDIYICVMVAIMKGEAVMYTSNNLVLLQNIKEKLDENLILSHIRKEGKNG